MARRDKRENPPCPGCGSRLLKNGSVRGKKRYLCRRCRKTYGIDTVNCLPNLRTPIEEVMRSLIEVWKKGSFNKAQKVTGHKGETLARWAKHLYNNWGAVALTIGSNVEKLGVKKDAFEIFLHEVNKKRLASDVFTGGWALTIRAKSDTQEIKELFNLVVNILSEPERTDIQKVNIIEVHNLLYEKLWKKIIFPEEAWHGKSDPLSMLDAIDRDTTYQFIKTFQKALILVELSANWTEALRVLERLDLILEKPETRWQKLLRGRLCDITPQERLIDWCYMKKAQFYHKSNPLKSIKITNKRKELLRESRLGKRSPELITNCYAWLVLFFIKAGRTGEKQTADMLERILKDYSKESLFPEQLLAKYYSQKAVISGWIDKIRFLGMLDEVTEKILSRVSNNASPRQTASTYIDTVQLYKELRTPNDEDIEHLEKAANIVLKYGYPGQARQLIKLSKEKIFLPDQSTIKKKKKLATSIKHDRLYRL